MSLGERVCVCACVRTEMSDLGDALAKGLAPVSQTLTTIYLEGNPLVSCDTHTHTCTWAHRKTFTTIYLEGSPLVSCDVCVRTRHTCTHCCDTLMHA